MEREKELERRIELKRQLISITEDEITEMEIELGFLKDAREKSA